MEHFGKIDIFAILFITVRERGLSLYLSLIFFKCVYNFLNKSLEQLLDLLRGILLSVVILNYIALNLYFLTFTDLLKYNRILYINFISIPLVKLS